jgi:hypothetical protein
MIDGDGDSVGVEDVDVGMFGRVEDDGVDPLLEVHPATTSMPTDAVMAVSRMRMGREWIAGP